MKTSILLLAFAALVFTSCSTAYKSGQTPDDVYYSEAPDRESGSYVEVEKRDDRAYQHSEDYYEDRYLRYRVQNRYRWSTLDDYYYQPSYAWHYGSYNNWYSPYSSYHCWNSYYNPYYGGVVIIKNPGFYRPPSRPIAFNPSSYNSSNPRASVLNKNNYSNGGSYNGSSNTGRYNNSNNNRGVGGSVRRIFSNDNSSGSSGSTNTNSSSTPSRNYNPSSSSSSSSSSGRSGSSSSSGGSGASRPAR
jgi:hypothetical protein